MKPLFTAVLAALTSPIRCTPGAPDAVDSPLHRLEHAVHPWSAYAIIPLFGFVNAGLALNAKMFGALLAPLSLGVAMGLFIGKQLGIFGAIIFRQSTRQASMASSGLNQRAMLQSLLLVEISPVALGGVSVTFSGASTSTSVS